MDFRNPNRHLPIIMEKAVDTPVLESISFLILIAIDN